jgi:hypothetical protein
MHCLARTRTQAYLTVYFRFMVFIERLQSAFFACLRFALGARSIFNSSILRFCELTYCGSTLSTLTDVQQENPC